MGKVLHASYSGYFTECIGQGEKENPSSYPLECSLELAMALFWRVKTWNVEGYLTDRTETPVHVNKFTQEAFTPSTEEDLVCSAGFSITTFVGFNPFESILFGCFNFDLSELGIKKIGGEDIYLPRIRFEGAYTGDNFSKQGISFADPGATSGNLTLNLLDQTFTIPLFRQPDLVPPDPLAPYFENGDWTIEANEYWSYNETYDTTTGQRL